MSRRDVGLGPFLSVQIQVEVVLPLPPSPFTSSALDAAIAGVEILLPRSLPTTWFSSGGLVYRTDPNGNIQGSPVWGRKPKTRVQALRCCLPRVSIERLEDSDARFTTLATTLTHRMCVMPWSDVHIPITQPTHTHTHTVFTFFLGAAFTSPARRQNSHTAFLFFLRVARTSPDASNAQAPHVRKSFERHLDSQHTNQHSPTAFAPLLRATSTSPAVPAVSMSASSWIHRDRCTGPSTPLMAGSWRPRWSPRSPATLVVEKYV